MKSTKCKDLIIRLISGISPKIFFTLAYFHNRGKIPNFKEPKDISEIFIRQLLDGIPSKHFYLADKLLVRKYVKDKGLGGLLTPLIGVYSNPEEINFALLPAKFAIKMNYGAGMNIICSGDKKLDICMAKKKIRKWLSIRKWTGYSLSERHYNLIDRKIIVEEFIDDGNGGFPTDYKFMCANGRVFCVLACFGRESAHATYMPYSLDWKYLSEYDRRNHERPDKFIECPRNLKEMVRIAEVLSYGLGAVRIDLYSSGSRIWFGEITLTPSGCILHGWTQKAIDDMGEFYRNSICK